MEKNLAALMVIDGNSIINRAFYGVRPLSTKEGLPTNAVYGFLTMLKKWLNDYSPSALCVAFDLPAPTFRHKLSEQYKANRKGMPDELAAQMPILKEVLQTLKIPYFELSGYEADDLIGTFSKKACESNMKCYIVTGDRDSFQLVNECVSVVRIGTKDTKVYTPDAIFEEYGLTPAQMIDLKALMGDSSDNIPGVPGVGEKTALTLMKDYGSLEKLYESIDGIKGKLQEKLIAGKDSAFLSRTLGTVECNAPIDINLDDLRRKNADNGEVAALFGRLEFTRLLKIWTSSQAVGGEQLSFAEEIELPNYVKRNVKAIWKRDFDEGNPLTEVKYDASIAAWLLQSGETDWEETEKRLKENGLWKLFCEIEMPLCEVLASMEHIGIKADRQALIDFGKELTGQLEELEKDIYSIAGKVFNIQSPKQLGQVLFEELELPHGRKTKSGWSTDADTLAKIDHPIAQKLKHYRELAKLNSTYVEGLLKCMDENDRIHSTFQMTATITGRLSSTEPNLQNIPVRTELGSRMRAMFIPSHPDWVLVDADYSQIELRVLAQIADDEVMKNAFEKGEDIHAVTASQVFNVSLEEVTSSQRRNAKAVNFGIVYGISEFSLAEDIGVSRYEAKRYIEQYLEKYSGVRAFMANVVADAKKTGFVTTLMGRKRIIPELSSPNFNIRSFGERAAMNTPIQGTAADIIKMAMNALYARLKKEKLQARLILQIHDELIVECPESEKEIVAKIMREEMENVFPLRPRLVAEAHCGKSWMDAK